jgi:PTS system mannitol-specific IIC component
MVNDKLTQLKVHAQHVGDRLSAMVLPNIGAFIAWGLIAAIFNKTGWWPNAHLATLVGPMSHYLLPLLIAYSGGSAIAKHRGGVVGMIATMGLIVGSSMPMFIGAMIMGPLGGWVINRWDRHVERRIPQGFEMLTNNFSAGIIGMGLALVGYVLIQPIMLLGNRLLAAGVDHIIHTGLLPLANILIEPAKVLFLNNAINQGILAPLGTQAASVSGQSILFLLETNPGPGLGVLLAFSVLGRGVLRTSASSAIIIQFLGGIHEIYFPFVLMRPLLLLAVIAGGVSGTFTFTFFNVGLRAIPSPGSIISILLMTPKGLHNLMGVLAGILVATVVSFALSLVILQWYQSNRHSALSGSISTIQPVKRVIFADEAGMGTSQMGRRIFEMKLQAAGLETPVQHVLIQDLVDEPDVIVITRQSYAKWVTKKMPQALQVVAVDNFFNAPQYDELIKKLRPEKII